MNSQFFNKIIWGFVLITLGVFFLLDQTGLIEFSIGSLVAMYWPVILIYIGLMSFLWQSKHHLGSAVWNLMICFVGVIFLLNNLELTQFSLGDLFRFLGPIALILFGISVLFKPSHKKKETSSSEYDNDSYDKHARRDFKREVRREERNERREQGHGANTIRVDLSKHAPAQELTEEEKAVLKDIHGEFGASKRQEAWDTSKTPKPPQSTTAPKNSYEKNKYNDFVKNYGSDGVQYKSSFIGDVHLGQQPWELTPMVISHFIGDTIIDLTRAAIPLGETSLTVSAFIGDVKIFIPNDMDIEVRVTANSFIGDMNILDRKENGMFRHLSTQTSYYDEAERKLVVTTSMFIGDVIVKKIG